MKNVHLDPISSNQLSLNKPEISADKFGKGNLNPIGNINQMVAMHNAGGSLPPMKGKGIYLNIFLILTL